MSAHFTQLFALLLSQKQGVKLLDAIARAKPLMTAAGEDDLWYFWMSRGKLATGDISGAESYASKIKDKELSEIIRGLTELAFVAESDDPKEIMNLMGNRYQRTGDPIHLFEYCESCYDAENWSVIIEYSTLLVTSVATASALRLVVFAAYNGENYATCIDLLEGREHFYSGGKYPFDIQRLRVNALRKTGRLHQAIPRAEMLALETGDSLDLLTLFSVRLEGADPKGAAVEARKLLTRSDLAAKDHLQIANALKIEDHQGAVAHLERALSTEDRSPGFITAALDLVFRLNQEHKFRDLLPHVQQSAKEGSEIRLLNPSEVIELIHEGANRQQQAENLYREGRISIQMAIEMAGGSFALIYDERFSVGAMAWPAVPPLYIRHGGRETPQDRQIDRLCIDISSLMLACQMGLIDKIEKAFKEVYIPSGTISVLLNEIVALQPHQPSKLESARIISSLVSYEEINICASLSSDSELTPFPGAPPRNWRAMHDLAKKSGGLLVDHFPLSFGFPPTPANLQSEDLELVVSCGDLFETLHDSGKLTLSEHEFAKSKLGNRSERADLNISIGSILYLSGNIIESFAAAGILDILCKNFKVFIEAEEWKRVGNLLDHEAKSSRLRGKLRDLLDKIQSGIGIVWRTLPSANVKKDPSSGLLSQCLFELINAETDPNTYIWIDDRFLNGFSGCGNNSIVTLYGIILELFRREIISMDESYGFLHLARKANLRHIPISSDEIIYHLKTAHIVDRALIESPELMIIRQYLAACLSDHGTLQLPPIPDGVPNKRGEIAYVIEVFESVRDCISKLWSDVSLEDVEQIVVQADWVLRSLWFEPSALPYILRQQSTPDDFIRQSLGESLSSLYCAGIGLKGARLHVGHTSESPRSLYFKWLRSRFAGDLRTLEAAADKLSVAFAKNPPFGRLSKIETRAHQILFGDILEELPQSLRALMKLSKETMRYYGIKQFNAVTVGDWNFDHKEFWRGVEKAFYGKKVQIATNNKRHKVSIKCETNDNGCHIYCQDREGEFKFVLSEEVFSIFDKSIENRIKLILSHPEWLDCEPSELIQKASFISGIPECYKRIEHLEQYRSKSLVWKFQLLLKLRVEGQPVKMSHFEPPSMGAFLNYYRISEFSESSHFSDYSVNSAQILVSEMGFFGAFRRFCKLPLPLPVELTEAYDQLSLDCKLSWYKTVEKELSAPVERLHIAVLVSRFDGELAFSIIQRLWNEDGQEQFEGFKAILIWTDSKFSKDVRFSACSRSMCFIAVWCYASMLYGYIVSGGGAGNISSYFKKGNDPKTVDLFNSQEKGYRDVLEPKYITLRELIIHGGITELSETTPAHPHWEDHHKFIFDLCFVAAEPSPVAHSDLLTPANWRINSAGSYIQGDLGTKLERWLGDSAQYLSDELIYGLAKQAVLDIGKAPAAEPLKWELLASISVGVKLPAKIGGILIDTISDKNIRSLATSDKDARRTAIFLAVDQAEFFPEIKDSLNRALLSIADDMNSGLLISSVEEEAGFLIEAAHLLSLVGNGEEQSASEFCRIIMELVDIWPRLADELWILFRSMLFGLPAIVLINLWPLIFQLRKKSQS